MNNRRHFLKAGFAASMGSLALGQAWAAGGDARTGSRLIVIFLRGGMDGLFAFSPVDDPRLIELRPQLAQTVLKQGIRLSGTGFAAHPACAPLAQLFHDGELSFAPCAGTVDTSRSHFQAQDVFELGTGQTRGPSGFLARAMAELSGKSTAISFTNNSPLVFSGSALPVEVLPLAGKIPRLPEARLLDAIRNAHRGERTGDAIEQALITENDVAAALSKSRMEEAAARGAKAVSGFPQLAQLMGNTLKAYPRFSIAFMDLGGFDTHANQAPSLSRSLENLSEGIVALRAALGEREWDRTQVILSSEFGRTAKENGTQGTDHGNGGLMLMCGGAIKGGRMLGDFNSLAAQSLNNNRDLPVTLDWRSAIASAMKTSFGFSDTALNRIVPGRQAQWVDL
jgi:uncharacterized protein (DUF1501 family)